MKLPFVITVVCALIAGPAFTQDFRLSAKQPIAPPLVSSQYGVGPYWGIQGGINFYQSYEGTLRQNVGGQTFALEAKEKLGGFGGIKWGYGFEGNGGVRGALELDAFYNGADFDIEGRAGDKNAVNGTGRFDTGAFLINYLFKFGDTVDTFQPYLGGGVGGWFGQINDARLTVNVPGGPSRRFHNDDTSGGFALQAVAGFDMFLSDSVSFFTEYKFLNYWGGVTGFGDEPTMQHLGGVGIRIFY